MTAVDWTILVLRPLLPVLATLMAVPIILWVERRGAGLMQDRPGPNRVGFFGWHAFGLGQPLADALKFFFKEDVTPDHVDAFLYTIAPWIVMFSALVGFAVIPYGATIPVAGRDVPLVGADVPIGALFIFAMAGLSVYGIVLAGWSSNNKYSLMGGFRSAAQVISYELAMTTAAAGVFLSSASLRLTRVVAAQEPSILRWNVVPQFFGFVVFIISAFAETNRVPFDLAEADAELVAGYHTEYSSFKFAAFFMAEYVAMTVASAFIVTMYFGGWSLPFFHPRGLAGGIVSVAIFAAKTAVFLWLFVWVRWTLPRFRYDQLMKLGWKILLPLALANLLWTALLVRTGVL
ncbi:MAG TPA: NADH-quinone oxidoreductase subunit NuoH [Thermoanaerobaculia bacterium]|nr:NADH-quinone oxidoreductase subunit NuoH [Thermoanaerobaculia bacterium]